MTNVFDIGCRLAKLIRGSNMTKYCVDCIHHEHSKNDGEHWCLRRKPVSPITGLVEQKYHLCEDQRSTEMKCGQSAHFYEHKIKIEGHNKVYKGVSEVPDNSFFAYGVAIAVMFTVFFVTLMRL